MSERSESNVGLTDLLDGFAEWWHGRRYDHDCPSDRRIAEDAWRAARGEQYYPCNRCGAWRTKAEGGTTFTVCDDCWHMPPNYCSAAKDDIAPPPNPTPKPHHNAE